MATARHSNVRPASRGSAWAHQARVLRVIAGSQFKLKYADSALGYVWSLLKPLAIFTVLYYVFGRFAGIATGFTHYQVYLLIGIVLWTFFYDATLTTMPSIVSQGTLLRKLSFPRLIIPLSLTATAALTFAINLLAIAAFMVWNRITPRLEWLLLPWLVLELLVFTVGVALVLATLFVRFRDIGQIWDLAGQLLFYASPIIFPVGYLPPWAQPVAFVSPFVQVMQDVRAVLLPADPVTTVTEVMGTWGRLAPIGVALATLLVGLLLFRRESPSFAERV